MKVLFGWWSTSFARKAVGDRYGHEPNLSVARQPAANTLGQHTAMNDSTDPYRRLRTFSTPAEEMCSCPDPAGLLLCQSFGPNPLKCLTCGGEVAPERIGISPSLAESLADWRIFQSAFDALWLDSAEFEDWARGHLQDPASPPNVRGMKLARELSSYRPCYLSWFEDAGADDFLPYAVCPRCSGPLQPEGWARVCKVCLIGALS